MSFYYGTTVLVEDPDVIWRSSVSQNIFFNRTKASITALPLALYSRGKPVWELLEDKWAAALPVQEVYSQGLKPPISFNFLLYLQKQNRIDEPEAQEYPHTNHAAAFFQFARRYAAQLVGYVTYVPDLCDDPWLEQVHRPPNPELAMMPYRQIPQFIRGQQFNLFFNQPRPWYVDGEDDTVNRETGPGVLLPWGRPTPAAIGMPNLIGLQLQVAINIINQDQLNLIDVVYEDTIFPIQPQPRGIVIGQWPLPGALVFPGFTPVVLIVSSGLMNLPAVGDSVANPPNTVIGDNTPP